MVGYLCTVATIIIRRTSSGKNNLPASGPTHSVVSVLLSELAQSTSLLFTSTVFLYLILAIGSLLLPSISIKFVLSLVKSPGSFAKVPQFRESPHLLSTGQVLPRLKALSSTRLTLCSISFGLFVNFSWSTS